MPIPLVVVGDGYWQPTGLGRIARDLVTRLRLASLRKEDKLPIRVSMIGWEQPNNPHGADWYMGHQDSETWGAPALEAWWAAHVDSHEEGIVFSIWDPARCFELRRAKLVNAQWWGYFPIDAHNIHGFLSGPAADVLQRYDRTLAYTRFGSRVLGGVDHLPHGLDKTFQPRIDQEAWELLGEVCAPVVKPDSILVGCVATNQPRKDLGLLFAAVSCMCLKDRSVKLWLHIDKQVGEAWSVPQLAVDFGLERALVVTTDLKDDQLAAMYSWCAVTIAPGLGEGFGYPIVESLACGTPVVHGTYGGGAELIPHPAWKFPERAHRVEGAYALVRPVYEPQDVANAVWRAIDWKRKEVAVVREYCIGAVQHLRWKYLWPHWEAWVKQGLDAL